MFATRILLVDDESAFISTLAKRLTARNLTVATALSGEEALKQLEQQPDTDVVVLDVKMPGMDGVQTLRRIKACYPLVEVIMLTGHATIRSAVDGMRLGAFDYLMKPCDIEELAAKVQEACAQRREHLDKILSAEGRRLQRRRGL